MPAVQQDTTASSALEVLLLAKPRLASTNATMTVQQLAWKQKSSDTRNDNADDLFCDGSDSGGTYLTPMIFEVQTIW